MCDRVAVLHRGKLVRLGRTADLLQSTEQTEIVTRGVAAHDFPGAVNHNGVVSVTVPISTQRGVMQRVWELGGEIISVNPVRRSLEQVFLEVTADSPAPNADGGQ